MPNLSGGWIKWYRKSINSNVWSDSDRLKLWLLLLMKANHTPATFLFNGVSVNVEAGQFVTGAHSLENEFNNGVKPSKRVGWRKLWRWAKDFENMQMLTIKSTTQYSVISVLNWDAYQSTDNQLTIKRQSSDNQVTTNKNVKNVKNEKNIIYSPNPESQNNILWEQEFVQLWQKYPNKRGEVQAKAAYHDAHDQGTTFDEVNKGIDNYNAYLKLNDKHVGFTLLGSTYFVNQRWKDVYDLKSLTIKNINKESKNAAVNVYKNADWNDVDPKDALPF